MARADHTDSSTPVASRIASTSAISWVSTHRATSRMVAPPTAAAKSSGASSLAAVAYQNSPSAVVDGDLATSVRSAATRRARQVAAAGSGDHRAGAVPVVPAGSRHQRVPSPRRHRCVAARRSVFTLAASTGPGHDRIAGTASPLVLPLWVGPTTATEAAGSVKSRCRENPPETAPRARRPGPGAGEWCEVEAARPAGTRPAAAGPAARPTVDQHQGGQAAAQGQGQDGVVHRPAIAASVSTSARSADPTACRTRKERRPTFHSATPRWSCGTRSASVLDNDSSSVARATSPGGCA